MLRAVSRVLVWRCRHRRRTFWGQKVVRVRRGHFLQANFRHRVIHVPQARRFAGVLVIYLIFTVFSGITNGASIGAEQNRTIRVQFVSSIALSQFGHVVRVQT